MIKVEPFLVHGHDANHFPEFQTHTKRHILLGLQSHQLQQQEFVVNNKNTKYLDLATGDQYIPIAVETGDAVFCGDIALSFSTHSSQTHFLTSAVMIAMFCTKYRPNSLAFGILSTEGDRNDNMQSYRSCSYKTKCHNITYYFKIVNDKEFGCVVGRSDPCTVTDRC